MTQAVSTLTPAAVRQLLLDREELALIDVREEDPYAQAHTGAVHPVLPAAEAVATVTPETLAGWLTEAGKNKRLTQTEGAVLDGGTHGWIDAGLPLEEGETRLAVPRTDRYRRPYESTDSAADAMQAYLDWEFGLVAQLERDGTHFFKVA